MLGIERVDRKDSFFTLGGDSIYSVTVMTRARKLHLDFTLPRGVCYMLHGLCR